MNVAVLTFALGLAAAPGPEDPAPLRTMVVGLEAHGDSGPLAVGALSALVVGAYAADRSRVVYGPSDLQRIFEWSGEAQLLGCVDAQCLGDITRVLRADRLVYGTLTLLESGVLIVLRELDAHSLTALAVRERTFPRDAESLVEGLQRLAIEVRDAASDVVNHPSLRGELRISTEPPGARVSVDGVEFGLTPVTLPDAAAGARRVMLTRGEQTRAVEVTAPVYARKATQVRVRFGTPTPPSVDALSAHRLQSIGAWSIAVAQLACAGGVLSFVGAAALAMADTLVDPAVPNGPIYVTLGTVMVGLGVPALVMLGLGAHAVWSQSPPPAPSPAIHVVTVTPPLDEGAAQSFEIQELDVAD